MDASSSNPADRSSGADKDFPGDSNKSQTVDKGKNRRSDSEERRAAEEAEDAELAQHMAEREAGVEEAREEWAVALRRRIERHEEDLRELRAREAEMHSSRGFRAPAPAPTTVVVPPATSGAGPTKRGRGRPPNPNKAPRVIPPKVKTPRVLRKPKSVKPERTPSRGAEDEDEVNDENDSDKEMLGDKKCDSCKENFLVCVVPQYSRKNRRACAWCHRKKVRCSFGNVKDTVKVETAKTPKRRPGKPEVTPADFLLRRTRGAVQHAEIHDLEAHCREMEEHIEVLNQRFGVTYWALVNVLKNFDNENAEARKKLFGKILKTLARFEPARPDDTEDEPPRKRRRIEIRRETPIGPESESETSADTHVKDWRENVVEAEMPEEFEYIDMGMEDAAMEVGPGEIAEGTPEVVPAMQNAESAPEVEQIAEQGPSVEMNAGEIAEETAGTIAEQPPSAEEIAERAPSVVQNAEAAIPPRVIPEVTPKVEEPPVVEGPAGVPAAPGMMWVQMPAPDQVVKAEGAPVVIRTPIQVPRNGPGDRLEDAIEIDDDDDEMEVDPPTAGKEGNSEEVNESEESPK
ncbi:hypothetical protein GGX14DRAFT_574042 [Mycena pura]|uniref:Zn(2)-C6 fungal-type domain-containing protein n=1 Tax=Mycena pura TaxID=153505 RepID=A0AAD6UY84_9AGAR|nr:hypothetical protein GGX14DRAFT_574042 [Mycena pura]